MANKKQAYARSKAPPPYRRSLNIALALLALASGLASVWFALNPAPPPFAPAPSEAAIPLHDDRVATTAQQPVDQQPVEEPEPTGQQTRPPEAAAPPDDRPTLGADAPALPGAVPSEPSDEALPPAPIAGLVESGAYGPLPIVDQKGTQPWQAYARPFDGSDGRPRIAVVLGGLGLSDETTQRAIDELRPAVTLAFSPFAGNLDPWIQKARGAGHEALLVVPMEPLGYPADDPGPNTLLTSLDATANVQRLEFTLSRTTGYFGIIDSNGERFTADSGSLTPIFDTLARRGIAFVDSGGQSATHTATLANELGVANAHVDQRIDSVLEPASIDLVLRQLEDLARLRHAVIAYADPYPLTLDRLARWLPTLEAKGIALAPVSALINRQQPPAPPPASP